MFKQVVRCLMPISQMPIANMQSQLLTIDFADDTPIEVGPDSDTFRFG